MLIEATTEIASRITGAIRNAAAATGASFDYLLKTALRESNLNPDAKASSSSATGLFQFIDQTWLGTLKKAGASLGYGNYAESIERAPSGRYVVQDPAQRQAIMQLRNDPDCGVCDGCCLHQRQRRAAEEKARPAADRRRTLHRAFHGADRRGAD